MASQAWRRLGQVVADGRRSAAAAVRRGAGLHRRGPRPRAVPGRAVDGGLVRARIGARLNAVPASAYDERLHEWRVREAMARSDWRAALAAIHKMGDKQRSDSRWQYFEARLSELRRRQGQRRSALYREAAQQARIPRLPRRRPDRRALRAVPVAARRQRRRARRRSRAIPAIVRAMGLYRIDRRGWAMREWDEALSRFNDDAAPHRGGSRAAHGWFDRAVFALGKTRRAKLAGRTAPVRTALPAAPRRHHPPRSGEATASIRPGSPPRSAPRACSIRARAPAPTRWA